MIELKQSARVEKKKKMTLGVLKENKAKENRKKKKIVFIIKRNIKRERIIEVCWPSGRVRRFLRFNRIGSMRSTGARLPTLQAHASAHFFYFFKLFIFPSICFSSLYLSTSLFFSLFPSLFSFVFFFWYSSRIYQTSLHKMPTLFILHIHSCTYNNTSGVFLFKNLFFEKKKFPTLVAYIIILIEKFKTIN